MWCRVVTDPSLAVGDDKFLRGFVAVSALGKETTGVDADNGHIISSSTLGDRRLDDREIRTQRVHLPFSSQSAMRRLVSGLANWLQVRKESAIYWRVKSLRSRIMSLCTKIYSTLWAIETCQFVFDYNSTVSWATVTLFVATKTETNTPSCTSSFTLQSYEFRL